MIEQGQQNRTPLYFFVINQRRLPILTLSPSRSEIVSSSSHSTLQPHEGKRINALGLVEATANGRIEGYISPYISSDANGYKRTIHQIARNEKVLLLYCQTLRSPFCKLRSPLLTPWTASRSSSRTSPTACCLSRERPSFLARRRWRTTRRWQIMTVWSTTRTWSPSCVSSPSWCLVAMTPG